MILNVGSCVKDEKGNKYILDEVISQEKSVCVYKSHRDNDNTNYVVKMPLTTFSDTYTIKSFINEMNLADNEKGENVIDYEYVHDGSVFPELPPYIIMQLTNDRKLSNTDNIIKMAIASKNAEDNMRLQKENEEKQLKKEKDDQIKFIISQFEDIVIKPIINFKEELNKGCTGNQKLTSYNNLRNTKDPTKFFFNMTISPNNMVAINTEVIFKENFTHNVIDYFSPNNKTNEVNYVPQYNNRNILAWAEIKNSYGYGFNILLLESGEKYGDFIIMNNANNISLTTDEQRREPFAFSLNELPKEINLVQAIHIYSSKFNEFNETKFKELIYMLSYKLK